MSYNILHFTIDYNEKLGAYNFLKKLERGLLKYNVSQKYLILEKNHKMKQEDIPENVFFYEDLDIEKFLNGMEKNTVIIFHESFATYVTNQVPMPSKFYKFAEKFPRIRMIHDYSTAVCPLFLDYNKYKNCQGTLKKECLDNKCISLDLYQRFINEVENLKNYDGIMCLSQNTINRILTYGFEKQLFFKIPPLINKGEINVSSTRDKKCILYASRINSQKGLRCLIEALIKIKDCDWKLIIAGEPEDKQYYLDTFRLARKEGILDRIDIKGYVDQEQLAMIRKEVSIFCFPSICHETFGFSGAEAIQSGLPVIAFDIEGVDEWLVDGENGFKCKLMDTDDLASHLKLLLNDEEVYNQLRDNCIKESENNDYDHQIEVMYRYIQKIAMKGNEKCVN